MTYIKAMEKTGETKVLKAMALANLSRYPRAAAEAEGVITGAVMYFHSFVSYIDTLWMHRYCDFSSLSSIFDSETELQSR